MVRLFWIGLVILAVIGIGLSGGLLGAVASDLAMCWAYNRDTCSFSCSVMNITLLSICLVVSALALIASIVQLIVSIVNAVKPKVKLQFHIGKPEQDWDVQKVQMSDLKPIDAK